MNSEVPKPELPSKLLTPWWDVCIYYTTAAMMVLSLTAIGLQTTKDHLVCLPTVDCTVYERSQSVGNENTSNDAPKVCSKLKVPRKERPSGTVVLTTMDDRRQYDYVDNNCYAQMSTFPAFFSLFFFGETLLLLITFNFWLKYTKTSCALSHFEDLLSEFNNFEIQVYEDLVDDARCNDYRCDMGELKIKVHTFSRKLLYFKKQYESEDYSHLSKNSVTLHYRFRCAFGTLLVLIFMIVNISLFYSSQNLSECRLEKALFSTGNEYFECTRSIASFYAVIVWSFTILLALNLGFLGVACLWAFREIEWEPSCTIEGNQWPVTLSRDFAFLIKLLEKSSPSFRQMSIVGNSLFLALHERDLMNILQDQTSDDDVESIGGTIQLEIV